MHRGVETHSAAVLANLDCASTALDTSVDEQVGPISSLNHCFGSLKARIRLVALWNMSPWGEGIFSFPLPLSARKAGAPD